MNNKVNVDLGGSVGERIKIELTKSTTTQTTSIASLTIKACIEIGKKIFRLIVFISAGKPFKIAFTVEEGWMAVPIFRLDKSP